MIGLLRRRPYLRRLMELGEYPHRRVDTAAGVVPPEPVNGMPESNRELTARELAGNLEQAIRDVVFGVHAALGSRPLDHVSRSEVDLWAAVTRLENIAHHPSLILARIDRAVG